MDNTLDIVRRRVGERDEITRREMSDILTALGAAGLDLRNGFLPPALTTPDAWADRCGGIECISVDAGGGLRDGYIRFDQPGSMHPMQYAQVLFAPAELAGHEYDQIGQMQAHAERVLVVSGEPLIVPDKPEAPPLAPGVARLRSLEWVDGVFIRVDDDGMLEMRDPNDGQSPDPRDKARHQYRLYTGTAEIEYRRLPPESVGDAWLDVGEPQWEPHATPPEPDSLIYRWWEECVM
jgi:hypothetical protein